MLRLSVILVPLLRGWEIGIPGIRPLHDQADRVSKPTWLSGTRQVHTRCIAMAHHEFARSTAWMKGTMRFLHA